MPKKRHASRGINCSRPRSNGRRKRDLCAACVCVFALSKVFVSGDDFTCDAGRSCAATGPDPAWPLREDAAPRTLVVPDEGGGETGGRTLTVDRLSSHPPIFRVRKFLTPEECETLRRLAVEEGLVDGYVDSDDALSAGGGEKKKKKMRIFDSNGDGRLSVHELIRMFDDFFESHLSEDDIRSVLSLVGVPLDDSGTVSIQDFVRSDTASIRRFFLQLVQDDPSKLSRYSRMAWLNARALRSKDDAKLLESIRQRVALLTKLPETVVHGGMEMQVVYYPPRRANGNDGGGGSGGGGHYTAHFDSLALSPEVSCCHITGNMPPCRPCRLATILYNLSDGDEGNGGDGGGYTAFPLAGKLPGECTAEAVETWRMSAASRQSSYCAETGPGLRVKPDLGQAILWYNHDISHLATQSGDSDGAERGLLGELDRSTLHAGCPSWLADDHELISNSPQWNAPGKWIANHWIGASDVPGEDENHYQRMTQNV